jgi:C4-dicarboxylate transporter
MMNMKNSKKGQGIIEIIVAVVVIFVFVVITVFGNRILNDFNTDFQADSTIHNESKAVVSDLNNRYSTTFDALVPFIYVIMLLICVAAGWFSNTNPVLFVILVIIVIFLMVVGGILSNTWEDLKSDDSISTQAIGYPMSDYILTHYMLFDKEQDRRIESLLTYS